MPSRKTRSVMISLGMTALGCGDDGLVEPQPPAAPPTPVALAIVSGADQEGKAGERLAPFVVRVTDTTGSPLGNVTVAWSVTAGAGVLIDGEMWDVRMTRTRSNGVASVTYLPTVFGTSTVSATVLYRRVATPVSFTAHATALVLDNGGWGAVLGPGGSAPHVTVPVGGAVEWMNHAVAGSVRVSSTSAPTGGMPFDSGTLSENTRFRFVPEVPGVWEWTWEYLEFPGESWAVAEGTLTVQ